MKIPFMCFHVEEVNSTHALIICVGFGLLLVYQKFCSADQESALPDGAMRLGGIFAGVVSAVQSLPEWVRQDRDAVSTVVIGGENGTVCYAID